MRAFICEGPEYTMLRQMLIQGTAAGLVFLFTTGLAAQEPAKDKTGQTANQTTKKAKPTTRKAKPRLPKGCVAKTITLPNGAERKYVVFVPPQYILNETYRWPVVVSLHGSGECGTDGIKHTTVGLPRHLGRDPNRFPFIAVMPQAKTLWYRGGDAAAVWAVLAAVHREYRTDPDRVYLTGFSMGGFATWELSVAHPDVFAAIVPICGIGPIPFMSNITHLPVWAFHGAKDQNVPVKGSREPIAALKRLGANPRYTEYAEADHFCWDRVYRSREMWDWLLAQRRKPAPRAIDYRFLSGSAVVWWLGVQAEDGLKRPAHIRAVIDENGRVTVQSEGAAGWAIKCETYPLKIGDEIDVAWNGEHVYKGEFTGGIATKPREDQE